VAEYNSDDLGEGVVERHDLRSAGATWPDHAPGLGHGSAAIAAVRAAHVPLPAPLAPVDVRPRSPRCCPRGERPIGEGCLAVAGSTARISSSGRSGTRPRRGQGGVPGGVGAAGPISVG
jgi:hypothetical protein